MDEQAVTKIVLKVVEEVCCEPVTLDTYLQDVLDSLERASLAVELNDYFTEENLIEKEKFFTAKTVRDLVHVILDK